MSDFYQQLVRQMDNCKGKERQHLISDYYYDSFDPDALTKMPASFFGELLIKEEDPICQWFEIKALGEYKAIEYCDVIIGVLEKEDFSFDGGSSLHLIAATAIGKIGSSAIPKLINKWDKSSSETRLGIIDSLGEMRCEEAAEAIGNILYDTSDISKKEFIYAALALSKCSAKGNEILRELYSKVDYERKMIIIDALAGSEENDIFLNEIAINDVDIFDKALSLDTSRISLYKQRRGK